jgi:hypothetical protein
LQRRAEPLPRGLQPRLDRLQLQVPLLRKLPHQPRMGRVQPPVQLVPELVRTEHPVLRERLR